MITIRVRLGKHRQIRLAVSEARAGKIRALARALVLAGKASEGEALLRRAAEDPSFDRHVEALTAGKIKAKKTTIEVVTFRDLAKQWTGGDLARMFPDHVRVKRSADLDEGRLDVLSKSIGDVAIASFRLEDAERAMASLPPDLSPATRRQYAQLISKVLKLATYPLKLIDRSPLPAGFLPAVHGLKIAAWLFPDEDRGLLACEAVPLTHRVLYGICAREGMRLSEVCGLRWRDVERGAIVLDKNKTDDPRTWAVSPGTAEALAAIRPAKSEPDWLIFPDVVQNRAAQTFRDHLALAGVTRTELFERSKIRRPIRVHDLRATFVTLSLANGKTETWVSDRTGHKSSVMINRYRRAARTASELGLGELARLDFALPETNPLDGIARALAKLSEGSSKPSQIVSVENRPLDPNHPKTSMIPLVSGDGIEPPTRGFSILCSTD